MRIDSSLALSEVQKIVEDPAVVSALGDAAKASMERVLYSKVPNPVHIPGCMGQFLYFHLIDCAENSLAPLGFERKYYSNQNRLVAEKTYDYPVSITFHGAKLIDKIAVFKWPRGNVTMKCVEQNQTYSLPLQPSLFEQPLPVTPDTKQTKTFNLFMLCDISPKFLRAWLVLGTEWTNKRKMLHCPVRRPILNETIDVALKQLPDNLADMIIPPNELLYDFGDFGERATGTYD